MIKICSFIRGVKVTTASLRDGGITFVFEALTAHVATGTDGIGTITFSNVVDFSLLAFEVVRTGSKRKSEVTRKSEERANSARLTSGEALYLVTGDQTLCVVAI